MNVIRLREVQTRVGLSRSSIYAAVANRSFPAPIKLGSTDKSRAVGWIAEEIDEYLADRVRARSESARGRA